MTAESRVGFKNEEGVPIKRDTLSFGNYVSGDKRNLLIPLHYGSQQSEFDGSGLAIAKIDQPQVF